MHRHCGLCSKRSRQRQLGLGAGQLEHLQRALRRRLRKSHPQARCLHVLCILLGLHRQQHQSSPTKCPVITLQQLCVWDAQASSWHPKSKTVLQLCQSYGPAGVWLWDAADSGP